MPLNVLLVEDNADIAMLTTDALAYGGHTATLAASVSEAVRELTARHSFAIVLLDLELPDGRGEEIVHRLRSRQIVIPAIIILSGLPLRELDAAVLVVAAVTAIRKPYETSVLLEAMALHGGRTLH